MPTITISPYPSDVHTLVNDTVTYTLTFDPPPEPNPDETIDLSQFGFVENFGNPSGPTYRAVVNTPNTSTGTIVNGQVSFDVTYSVENPIQDQYYTSISKPDIYYNFIAQGGSGNDDSVNYQVKFHSKESGVGGEISIISSSGGTTNLQLSLFRISDQNSIDIMNDIDDLRSRLVISSGGTISNDFEKVSNGVYTFSVNSPSSGNGTFTVTLPQHSVFYLPGENTDGGQTNAVAIVSPSISYGSMESALTSVPLSMTTISKKNRNINKIVYTGNYNRMTYQNLILASIQSIIRNVYDKNYVMATPRESLFLFVKPTSSTQPEVPSSSLLQEFLLKKNSLTFDDTANENDSLKVNAAAVKIFSFISDNLFTDAQKGAQYIESSSDSSDFIVCDTTETSVKKGKLSLIVNNCLFDICLNFA